MLVLTRKTDESLWIGRHVRITVLRVARDRVRLDVQAPRSVQVAREELLLRRRTSGEAVCSSSSAQP